MVKRVEEWLKGQQRPIHTHPRDARVSAMIDELQAAEASDLWVVDAAGRYLGHVDFIRLAGVALGERQPTRSRRAILESLTDARASDLMDSHIRPVHRADEIDAAIHQMLHERVESLPVVDDDGRVIGAIHLRDVLRWARAAQEPAVP